MIPLCVPKIDGNEWLYVKECLDSNWVSSVGSYVTRFERMMAERVNRRFAVATVNGTAALHVALIVAGVQPGDLVLVSDLTFVASANAIRYCGADPVLIDAEAAHLQMDVTLVERYLVEHCRRDNGAVREITSNRRVAALLPVHILGHPCDLDVLTALADQWGLPLVEDASESLGASWRDRPVGSHGLLACFSFNGNKIITTGGGGMVVTDDEALAARLKYLTTQAKDDELEFDHGEIGYNYRLTNLQAAMGVAQLEQLDAYVDAKRAILSNYRIGLSDVPGLSFPTEDSRARSCSWMAVVLIDAAIFGVDSRHVLHALAAQGIQTRPLWRAMHNLKPYMEATRMEGAVAEALVRDGLCLPCSVGLHATEQDRVIAALRGLAGR